jgi:riboflavin kinase/FMN adenylyltransferase
MFVVNWNELPAAVPDEDRRTALTIGVFDGVHRGHRALIEKITAKAPELIPAVITFRSSSMMVKSASYSGPVQGPILDHEEKLALFETLGVELCTVIDFSPEFATLEGQEFFSLVRRFLRPAYIAIGWNFHCGHGRATDAQMFGRLGQEYGVEVEIAPPVMEGGRPVSSSRIREAFAAGHRDKAALLLGRAQ